jgi:tripartite-type tricarboxylate transporter receptor subunit TctC
MNIERIVERAGAGVLAVLLAVHCWAADYPARPVQMIVPFAPGASTDVTARLLAGYLEQRWKQPFVVVNRPGAGGVIGTDAVAKSAPDGYTLLVGVSWTPVMHLLHRDVPFDALRDLMPVSIIGASGYVLMVPSSLPVNSFQELVAHSKNNPGKLNFGSPGGDPLLEFENLRGRVGWDIVPVTYKGGGPALNALLAGEVQLMFGGPHQAAPLARAGKIRPLAVTLKQRHALLPDVPTMEEAGVAGYEAGYWIGMFVPARTPADIVAMLNREIAAFQKDPEMTKRFAALGWDAVHTSPERTLEIMTQRAKVGAEVARRAGIKPE